MCMTWNGFGQIAKSNDPELTLAGHLVIRLFSQSSCIVAIVPHSFGLSQLSCLLNKLIGNAVQHELILSLSDSNGRLMTVKTDEDLRQVYYWHSCVQLHQIDCTQQHQPLPTSQRWGCLQHHVTIWLCREPLSHQLALLAPRTLSFDSLLSASLTLLSGMGHAQSSASSDSVHAELLVSQSNECHICQPCLGRSLPASSNPESVEGCRGASIRVIRDEADYRSLCNSICCCQLQLRNSSPGTAGGDLHCASSSHHKAAEALGARQWALEDFDYGRERICLGVGQFGTVHLAMCRLTGRQVALKSIDLCSLGGSSGRLEDAEIERLMTELQLLADCRHENIVTYLCSFFEHSDGRLYIGTEVMDGGSLDKLGLADEPVLGYVFQCAVSGLCYLWDRRIVHRDVKLANILACRRGRVKICDLGLAKEAVAMRCDGETGSSKLSTALASTFCGSYEYMSPERIDSKRYGHLADVWSLGVSMYELACGLRPFSCRGVSLGQMLTDIRQARVPPMPAETAQTLSTEFHQLCAACLQRKAKHRPSKQTIKSLAFYTKYAGLSDSGAVSLREHFKVWLANALSRIGR